MTWRRQLSTQNGKKISELERIFLLEMNILIYYLFKQTTFKLFYIQLQTFREPTFYKALYANLFLDNSINFFLSRTMFTDTLLAVNLKRKNFFIP